eukprot:COSAG06_NODE_5561_length_3401_cov_2306.993640_4_plen_294_part_00
MVVCQDRLGTKRIKRRRKEHQQLETLFFHHVFFPFRRRAELRIAHHDKNLQGHVAAGLEMEKANASLAKANASLKLQLARLADHDAQDALNESEQRSAAARDAFVQTSPRSSPRNSPRSPRTPRSAAAAATSPTAAGAGAAAATAAAMEEGVPPVSGRGSSSSSSSEQGQQQHLSAEAATAGGGGGGDDSEDGDEDEEWADAKRQLLAELSSAHTKELQQLQLAHDSALSTQQARHEAEIVEIRASTPPPRGLTATRASFFEPNTGDALRIRQLETQLLEIRCARVLNMLSIM